MTPHGTELLISGIAIVALLLTPLVSLIIGKVGEEISRQVGSGLPGPPA
jgi:hypothetical protein